MCGYLSVISKGKLFITEATLDLKYFVASVVLVLYVYSSRPAPVVVLYLYLLLVKIVGCVAEVTYVCAFSRNL